MRYEDGGIIIDGQQVGSTQQCPHCGGHFQMVPGSGRVRSFCLKCSKVTCGGRACVVECDPIEARLENAEGKRTNYDQTIEELISAGACLL